MLTPGEGSFYVVRIEAFADPTPPHVDLSESLTDVAAEYERLIEQMRDMSEQELLDQVYRRVTLHLCAACYRTADGAIGRPSRIANRAEQALRDYTTMWMQQTTACGCASGKHEGMMTQTQAAPPVTLPIGNSFICLH